MLELIGVTRKIGEQIYTDEVNLALEPGAFNVLLGPTLSGKTSLLRLMAGLDQPDAGDIRSNGKSVLGVPVQKRRLAMVYQQFINYPSLTVYENIASPLKIAGERKQSVREQVTSIAELLQLVDFLDRKPSTLSGGQQQRVALARALVKNADLVLLDEPLANLDYKLREEMRQQLPKLFAEKEAIVVYATSEPSEALILGGKTACLHQGKIVQFDDTLAIYQNPDNLTAAATFSDPPINTVNGYFDGAQFLVSQGKQSFTYKSDSLQVGEYVLAIKPHHLQIRRNHIDDIEIAVETAITELSGSESFVHMTFCGRPWVALLHGIHPIETGQAMHFFVNRNHLLFFHKDTELRGENKPG